MIATNASIRILREDDIEKLAHTFTAPWMSFEATFQLWERYFEEQRKGVRTACVIEWQSELVGYGSLLRHSEYPFFKEKHIPEINAVWIGDDHREQGLGTRLLKHLEKMAIDEGYTTIGIGVGLYRDYGPAQRMSAKLGYVPDGNGLTYKCTTVVPGETYPVDDDLILWLTKKL